MSNELAILIEVKNPVEVFTKPNGLDAIIDKIEADVKSVDRDISTEEGRDNIRSLAFKLAKSKKEIERMALGLTDGWRTQTKSVNTERDRGVERMQKLQDEIRSPLTAWENAEKERVQAHEDAIAAMVLLHPRNMAGNLTEDIQSRISDLGNMPVRDWEEFEARAAFTRKETAEALLSALVIAQKRDSEALELARLRAAEDARLQKERDDKIAAEAAAKAKAEAEERAAAEAAAAAKKAADEKAEIQRKADEEKAAAEKREAESKAALEKAEADRRAQEQKAIEDAHTAKVAADKAAKKAADDAAEAERKKIADEKAAEEKATAQRTADQAHKAKINNEALAALQTLFANFYGEDQTKVIKALISEIAYGRIPHINIKY